MNYISIFVGSYNHPVFLQYNPDEKGLITVTSWLHAVSARGMIKAETRTVPVGIWKHKETPKH